MSLLATLDRLLSPESGSIPGGPSFCSISGKALLLRGSLLRDGSKLGKARALTWMGRPNGILSRSFSVGDSPSPNGRVNAGRQRRRRKRFKSSESISRGHIRHPCRGQLGPGFRKRSTLGYRSFAPYRG